MTQIDKDRFFSMAACYDRMAPYFVPKYEFLQEQVVDLLFADGDGRKLVVDLGAGSGIFLQRILTRFPDSRGVWVDYSDDFHRVARERLAPFGSRARFVLCPLEQDWESHLGEAPAAICSMSAIHHLESAEKRRLYQRCHDVLRPGGWLFNIDEMSTIYADAYRNTLLYWLRHVERAAAGIPAELSEDSRAWRDRFDKWRQRNVERLDRPKAKGDDIHEGFVEQMAWLREAGFVDVDLFMKLQLWSVIGGRKLHPASMQATI